jgi:hypothetical protein
VRLFFQKSIYLSIYPPLRGQTSVRFRSTSRAAAPGWNC